MAGQGLVGYDPWLHTPSQLEKLTVPGVVLKPLTI